MLTIACSAGKITTFRRVWNNTHTDPFDVLASNTSTLGTDWAADGVFAEILYATYSEEYFSGWWVSKYDAMGIGLSGFESTSWVQHDFGKPGSTAQDRQVAPKLVDAWTYDSKYDDNTVCGYCFCLHCVTTCSKSAHFSTSVQ
jgi:hypothetical protein